MGRKANGSHEEFNRIYFQNPTGKGLRITFEYFWNGYLLMTWKVLFLVIHLAKGYFDTYDLAKRDAEGNYQITGRVDDAIKFKGVWLEVPKIEGVMVRKNLSAETMQGMHQIVANSSRCSIENDSRTLFPVYTGRKIASISSLCLVFKRMIFKYVMDWRLLTGNGIVLPKWHVHLLFSEAALPLLFISGVVEVLQTLGKPCGRSW